MISLSAHNHCSGDGATKSQVAVSSVPFARAAAMLCFSDKVKRVSGCLQTKFDGFFAAVRLAFQPQSYCLELLTLSSAEHVCRKSDGTADTIWRMQTDIWTDGRTDGLKIFPDGEFLCTLPHMQVRPVHVLMNMLRVGNITKLPDNKFQTIPRSKSCRNRSSTYKKATNYTMMIITYQKDSS